MRTVFFCGIWTLLQLFASGCHNQTLYSEREWDYAQKILADPALVEKCRGTPAEFAANTYLGMTDATFMVKNEISDREHADAIKRLAKCYMETQQGLTWQAPITNTDIPELKTAPIIDGAIAEEEWRGSRLFSSEYLLNSELPLPTSGATWRIGYHEEVIYIGCRFQDRQLNIFSGRIGESGKTTIYEGDCLEFFVHPKLTSNLYYEFLINPSGEIQVLQHAASKLWKWVPVDLEVQSGARVGVVRDTDGYSIELEIPLTAFYGLRYCRKPLKGEKLNFIFVRINRDGNQYRKSSPVPFLYDGHNTFGYIRGTFRSAPSLSTIQE